MEDKEAMIREGITDTIARIEPGLSERLETDPATHLRLVSILASVTNEAEETLKSAVDAARAAGLSWGQIGETIHVSRQAAQQRFGRPAPTPSGPDRRMISATAFTEMERLEQEGQHGWHSVGFGPFFHELAASEEQWEHRRVSVFASRAELTADGWQKIPGTWFPWAYYARPTGIPATPNGPHPSEDA